MCKHFSNYETSFYFIINAVYLLYCIFTAAQGHSVQKQQNGVGNNPGLMAVHELDTVHSAAAICFLGADHVSF